MPRISSITSRALAGLGLKRVSWKSSFTLTNPNAFSTATNDQFGLAVAASDNYIVVAAPYEGDSSGTQSGKVYIYDTAGTLLHTLSNPNPVGTSATDRFGNAVAINGSIVFVGAYLEDTPSQTNQGNLYAFSAITGLLVFGAAAPGSGTGSLSNAGDRFGSDIATAGDFVVVSAPSERPSSDGLAGAVYVYRISTSSLLYTLSNPNGGTFADSYGQSVAIDGNLLAVGAPYDDTGGETDSGAVYIYNLTTETLEYSIFGTDINGWSGLKVSMNNGLLAVASISKVKVYVASTGELLYTLDNPNPSGTVANDNFGSALSISGNYIVIGAYGETVDGANWSGNVYIYSTSGQLLQTFPNPNPVSGGSFDYFGYSIALTNNRLYAGAPSEDVDVSITDSGRVYAFELK
jgi:hypothetical protein